MTAPVTAEYDPAGHEPQLEELELDWKVPEGQLEHTLAATEE